MAKPFWYPRKVRFSMDILAQPALYAISLTKRIVPVHSNINQSNDFNGDNFVECTVLSTQSLTGGANRDRCPDCAKGKTIPFCVQLRTLTGYGGKFWHKKDKVLFETAKVKSI